MTRFCIQNPSKNNECMLVHKNNILVSHFRSNLNHHNGGSSFLWYLVDCNTTNTTINQISLLPVHQVSSRGHVTVTFAVCFCWIVKKY